MSQLAISIWLVLGDKIYILCGTLSNSFSQGWSTLPHAQNVFAIGFSIRDFLSTLPGFSPASLTVAYKCF